jgi:hypothetical protein
MPKQSSLITFTGKMDGISFYKKNGQHLARKAGGPSRSRIMNDPKFARTRENLTEFSGLAVSVSSFTQMFSAVKNFKDGTLRGRLVKILRSITKLADGIRGQRSIEVSKNRELLQGVEMNSTLTLKTSIAAKFNATHSADRSKGTITIANVDVNNAISAPPVATHFKLVQLLGVVSDIGYHVDMKKYVPLDGINNSIYDLSMTDYLSVSGGAPLSVTLEATLTPTGALGDNVSVVQCLGIIFFQKMGTAYYPLNQGIAMKIVDLF